MLVTLRVKDDFCVTSQRSFWKKKNSLRWELNFISFVIQSKHFVLPRTPMESLTRERKPSKPEMPSRESQSSSHTLHRDLYRHNSLWYRIKFIHLSLSPLSHMFPTPRDLN